MVGLIKRAVFVLILAFLATSIVRNIYNYYDKQQFYDGYKDELKKEAAKNISLKTQMLKKSDPNELEKTIRNKLSLSKEGETVVVLPEPSPTPIVITPTPAPNWIQWWWLFMKNN